MTENIDIFLEETNGQFDIVFEDGDIKSINGFDTSIWMTVYEERRADESEQPVAELRRGWWGNELSDVENYEIGSKLWQAYQKRANLDTANKIATDLTESFQWYVEDGHLDNVLVNSQLVGSDIDITITLQRSNNIETKSFKLWENTPQSE